MTRRNLANGVACGAGVLLYCVVSFWHLGSSPPLWWDEGWTMAAARNWVERGYVGQLLDNVPRSPGLAAQVTVIAPVALSFRLLGVGPWQGRLPGVLFTAATLWLLFRLTRRLYDPPTAWCTLACALLFAPGPHLHPILLGRQVLGEMPMLFYLLAGYSCFLTALNLGERRAQEARVNDVAGTAGPLVSVRELRWILAAVACWGLGLVAKLQPEPFFVLSLLVPIGASILARKRRITTVLGLGLMGALAMLKLIPLAEFALLRDRTQPVLPMHGLYDVTAFVTAPAVRLQILMLGTFFALPVACGLSYTARESLKQARRDDNGGTWALKLAMATLAGSWLAWYLFLSVGAGRYLFPPLLLGSMALGVLLRDAVRALGTTPRSVRPSIPATVGGLLLVALLAVIFQQAVRASVDFIGPQPAAPTSVAHFLNTATPPGALIETYDAELFFLLERRYHYPPDQLHVELIRRWVYHQDVPIVYDPLATNPDYLVVGPFSRGWRLYDPVLASGAFKLVTAYPGYEIYERVRH